MVNDLFALSSPPAWGSHKELKAATLRVIRNMMEIEQIEWTVVAMGNQIARRLEEAGVPHLKIVHPAARGIIRRAENYDAHIGGSSSDRRDNVVRDLDVGVARRTVAPSVDEGLRHRSRVQCRQG
jgi:hypothetical protein